MLLEFREPRAPECRDALQHRAHRELRLVHGSRVDDRAQHVDRGLMHARGHPSDVVGRKIVVDDELQQRVGRGMRVPARRVEFELRFGERQALPEPVGEARRVGIGRHPGCHALWAFENVLRRR